MIIAEPSNAAWAFPGLGNPRGGGGAMTLQRAGAANGPRNPSELAAGRAYRDATFRLLFGRLVGRVDRLRAPPVRLPTPPRKRRHVDSQGRQPLETSPIPVSSPRAPKGRHPWSGRPARGSDRAFKKQRLPLAKISEDQRRPAFRRLVLSCHVPLRPPPVGLEFAPSVPPVPLPACLRASGHWAGSAGVASGLSRASGDRWIARGVSPWKQAQTPFLLREPRRGDTLGPAAPPGLRSCLQKTTLAFSEDQRRSAKTSVPTLGSLVPRSSAPSACRT